MTASELVTLIIGVCTLFLLLPYVGEIIGKTPKIFTYGKSRKFLK